MPLYSGWCGGVLQVKAMMTHFDMDQDGYLSFAEANYLMVSTEGGEPMSDDDWPALCLRFLRDAESPSPSVIHHQSGTASAASFTA